MDAGFGHVQPARREANAGLTSILQERLAGIRVLKLFGRTDVSARQVEAHAQELADANLSVVRLREGLKPVYSTLMLAGVALVIGLGGEQVISGAMTIGAFVAFIELFLRFANRAHRIPQMFNSIQGGSAAYARLKPLLAPALGVEGEPALASFQPGQLAGLNLPLPPAPKFEEKPLPVRLQGVTFSYPGTTQPALEDVSLDILGGSFVAVTGPVGCGKSALIRAILGIYPFETGDIRVDGRELAGFPPEERASRIGYLSQEPYLFSGSIRENIAFGVEHAEGEEESAKP